MSKVRVRFAPSPTGYLHIGGVRTALFNWLWAQKTGGDLILRIENTDLERSTPESEAIILESLKWLGITWTEGPEVGGPCGPYKQMDRLDIYKHYADKLIASGHAYKCYCTEEDLRTHREALKAKREAGDKTAFFKYPGTCRDRKDNPDRPFVIRFKAPTEGVVEYNDLVFGKMVVPNKENQDFILMRHDGVPLYNFGATIDDLTMGITLVARGRDHAINTPPQILLYQALGAEHPQFAHLPMMLSPTGEKLSKRHGAVSTTEYRDAGFSPQAVLNYLAKFGWGFGNQEVFSIKDLIDKFSWEGCGRGDGRFDVKKFMAIEHEHLQRVDLTSTSDYAHRVIPFLYQRGLGDLNHERVEEVIHLIRHKCKTFVEAAHELDPILRKDISVDSDAAQKFLTAPNKEVLQKLGRHLSDSLDEGAWKEEALRNSVKNWLANNGLTLKDVGQPARVQLVGRVAGPELFQTMAALGKDVCIERMTKF